MSNRKKLSAKPKTVHTSWWIAFGLLVLVSLAAYWNSFGAPLVFDDLVTIQRNSDARFGEFNWNLLGARAVLYLTFTLNYIWTGQQVWSYHLINFLLHLFNGFLIFMLADRIFRHATEHPERSRQHAILAAAFFLVHPVQTESVTYISSRSELLSTFFYLTGLSIFVFWPGRKVGFLCTLAIAVPYFFGLGSKETVITLPATIFLYDFLFLSKSEPRNLLTRWRFYLPFILGAAAAIYFILTVALRGTIGQSLPSNLSPWHYFLTQLRIVVRYVQLVFVPAGLNLDYDFKPSASPLEPAVIASFVFLCGLLLLGWKLRRQRPIFAFSILWFFITLSPTSSIVPINDVIFEHRLYLPLVGVCFSFPVLIELIHQKLSTQIALPGRAPAYSCLILVALIVATNFRNYVWGDEVRLWTDIVSKSPAKIRPYNALAFAYYKRGEYETAISSLEKARERVPDFTLLSDTLGNFYLKTGRFDQAIRLFEGNTKRVTGEHLAVVYNNLGVAYLYKWNQLQAGRASLSEAQFSAQREQILKPASEAFLKGLEVDPDEFGLLDSYINVTCYREMGGDLQRKALDRLKEKETFEDLYTVGKVAFNAENYTMADQYFERAEKLKKEIKLLFFNHGYALSLLKDDKRAIEKYLQAIRVDPIFIEAHHNVGQIYMRQNEYSKAVEAFQEVLRQDSKHVSSNLYLASIYMNWGNKLVARTHLQRVLETSPGNQQAALMLQQLGL